jgi:hypothetical protein
MKHPEIISPFWILTLPVKMALCQLTYTTNRQINIPTDRIVILNIALGVFVWLSSAHERGWINYWVQDGMWWQMALLFVFFSVNTTCFVKTMVNARIVVTPLFQMTKPKGLKDILVRADITPRSAYKGQSQKCDSRRCMTCKNIQCTQK